MMEPMPEPVAAAVPGRVHEPVDVPRPKHPAHKVAPIVAQQVPAEEAMIQQVFVQEAPQREPHIQEIQAREVPPREVASRHAPVREGSRANPYFFREVEDDEELLLTREMNDSALNAHKLVPTAPRATALAPSQEREEPYLEAPRMSAPNPTHAPLAPNNAHATEESQRQVVDPMPWPSINDRRLTAPISAKEHGTGTPARRSWWRRSIGHNS